MNENERVGRDEVIQSIISILILAGDSLGYLVCGILGTWDVLLCFSQLLVEIETL